MIASLAGMSQGIEGKTWVNADHQTLIFQSDTVVFVNAGVEEEFTYKLDMDRLMLNGVNKLDFIVKATDDSLKLNTRLEEGATVGSSGNGGAVRFNQTVKLGDYGRIVFSDANTLHKNLKEFESIRLQTNACNGTCPVLDIILKSNGRVDFKGNAHVKNIGNFSGKLPKSRLLEFCELVKAGDLKGLKQGLKVPLDFPSYILTITYAGEVSSFTGYSFYEPLNQLVQQFLDFDTTLKLKKLE